jgi:hypothetical protein
MGIWGRQKEEEKRWEDEEEYVGRFSGNEKMLEIQRGTTKIVLTGELILEKPMDL